MARSRLWILAAFLFVVALSASSSAQPPDAKDKDKGKTSDAVDKGKAPDAPAPAAGDKVDIKWKFEKDKPFYQEMVTKTAQDT